jgi:hypothetical protein
MRLAQLALDQDVSVKCHEICSNNAPFVICRHLSKSLKRSQLTAPVADPQLGPEGGPNEIHKSNSNLLIPRATRNGLDGRRVGFRVPVGSRILAFVPMGA